MNCFYLHWLFSEKQNVYSKTLLQSFLATSESLFHIFMNDNLLGHKKYIVYA
jgi:hypothetical protein